MVITPAAVPTDEVTVQQYVEMEVARLSQKLTAVGAAGKQAVRQKGIEAKRTILESLNR